MISFFNIEQFVRSVESIDIEPLLSTLQEHFKDNGFDIDVTFVSLREIRALNAKHRGKDVATDVLSFEPVLDLEDPKADVFVCMGYLREETPQDKLLEETTRMVIHGILHVMGMQHNTLFDESKPTKEKMYLEQERILNVVLESIGRS